jgi:hypothetical protein
VARPETGVTRLPSALQPLWPVAKKVHRAGARGVGAVSRRTSVIGRGLPHGATRTSRETAALEPGTTRIHPAGDELTLRRPMPAGRPSDHWYFGTVLEQQVPERFVLDLDDATVLGPHVGVMTQGGLLDYETSHYFGIADWREHPVFLSPKAVAPEPFDGTLLALASRATGANYYHFLMDSLPRLGILEAALPDTKLDGYLVDNNTRYHRELIALLGLDRLPMLSPRRGLAVRARRLLVPSLPNISMVASPETTTWLREHLPPRQLAGRPERLYVTRGTTRHTRRMEHEEAVFASLSRRGFVRFDPGSVSVQEQIDHFAAARVIVAPHGAALTNLNFCRPGVRVLELFAPGYLNPGYWSITANVAESAYRYLVADTARPPRAGMLGVMHDIDVSPQDVDDALDDLLEGCS